MNHTATRHLHLVPDSSNADQQSGFQRSLAVVIGINDYSNGIPRLRTAGNDAARLAEILLRDFAYDVIFLADTKVGQQMEEHLATLVSTESPALLLVDDLKQARAIKSTRPPVQFTNLGPGTLATLRTLLTEILPVQVTVDDRLLFYFAGHGVALEGIEVEEGPVGYLIPQDAQQENRNSFWPMTEFYELLAALPCRHLLLMLDCCFAGALRWVTTRELQISPQKIYHERYERFVKSKAWQAITSTAYDQRALDVLPGIKVGERGEGIDESYSPFALAFFDALAGKGDVFPPAQQGQLPGDGLLTATELYQYLRDHVELKAKIQANHSQSPGLWPLRHHHAGEYVFLMPHRRLELENAPPLTFELNPYRGLRSYEEEHKDFFFGRRELVETLVKKVADQSLTVVLGASGTGKSSVVKAGVIPYLRNASALTGTQAEEGYHEHKGIEKVWYLLPVMRPAGASLTALRNLLEKLSSENSSRGNVNKIHTDPCESVSHTLTAWCQANPDRHLLLVIDQFEEMMTNCSEKQRNEFLDLLRVLLHTGGTQFHLILTLRSDFEPQFSTALVPEAQWMAARIIIPAMRQAELQEAIIKPAEARILYFDPPELVETLIQEVNNMPGALPLLSFTLSEMYRKYIEEVATGKTTGRALTIAYYQELGGVIGALSKRATQIYEKMDLAHQATMQRIMLRMIAIEGGELARRRVPLDELVYPSEAENARVQEVIDRLVEARLLVRNRADAYDDSSAAFVEPAHDALVKAWEWLLRWKQNFDEYLPLQRSLTAAAIGWRNAQEEEKKGLLWNNNPRLPQLQAIILPAKYRNEQAGNFIYTVRQALWPPVKVVAEPTWLNQLETAFVQTSVVRRANVLKQIVMITVGVIIALAALTGLAETQRREAESARVTAVAEANARATEVVLRTNAEVIANTQKEAAIEERDRANLEARKARASQLSTLSRSALQFSQSSILLAIEAWQLSQQAPSFELPEIDQTLQDIVESYSGWSLTGHRSAITSVDFSPDNRWLVSSDRIGMMRIWDVSHPTAAPTMLQADREAVYATAFSLDGMWRAAAGYDEKIRLWNLTETASPPWLLYGPLSSISSLSFSPDGKWLASGSDDDIVRIWEVAHPMKQPKLLRGHSADIESVRFTQGGQWLMSRSINGEIRLWDVEKLTFQPFLLPGLTRSVSAVTLSSDQRLLATATANGIIQVWDMHDRSLQRTFSYENESQIAEISFTADAQRLITGSYDGTLHIWALTDENIDPEILRGHADTINDIAVSPDNHWIVTTSMDRSIRLWDLTTRPISLRILWWQDGAAETVTFSSDGRWLASAGDDGIVRLWKADDLAAVDTKLLHNSTVSSASFSPNGKWLVSGDWSGAVRLWSADSLTGNPTFLQNDGSPIMAIAFSPDSAWVAAASNNGKIQLWNTMKVTDPPLVFSGHEGAVYTLAFSPSGSTLASGSFDRTIRLWDLTDPIAVPRILEGHESAVIALTFNHTGNLLVSASGLHYSGMAKLLSNGIGGNVLAYGNDFSVRIWQVDNLEAGSENLTPHKAPIAALAFSPDDRFLIGAGHDQVVRVWQTADFGIPPKQLFGHAGPVVSVAVSPNGQWLASAGGELTLESRDNNIRLWHLNNLSQEPRVIGGHTKWISSIAFSPDSNKLISASADETVRVANVPAESFLQSGCRIAGRNFTIEEWQRYFPTEEYRKTCTDLPIHESVTASLVELAVTRAISGEIDSAIAYYQKALAIDPALQIEPEAESQLEYGKALIESKRYTEAIPLLESAFLHESGSQADGNLAALIKTAQILINAAVDVDVTLKLLESVPSLRVSSNVDGRRDLLLLYLQKAESLAAVDRFTETIPYFEKAMALDPTLEIDPEVEARILRARMLAFPADKFYGALEAIKIFSTGTAQESFFQRQIEKLKKQAAEKTDYNTARRYLEEAYTLDATATSTARYDLLQLYLNQGQSLSASGDLTDAIVLYRHALELAEALEIEPEIKAYADYSKALSADEKFDEAVTQFELAWDLDPDFTHLNKIDLVRLYQSRGDQLAETGLITEAMQYYEKAHGLAPTLNLHSAVDAYIIYGKALMTSENYYAANTAFSQILALKQNFDITSTLSATEWNQICWHGTLSVVDVQAERASYLAPIIAACERAVALEPDSASIRDSRGVARALTEDVLGAIEDFSFYVEWSKENNPTSKYIASREDWISRLKAKEAPATVFDRETLLSLRDE